MLPPEEQRLVRQGFQTKGKELRTAVADLYNALHREGKESKYTWENVCIVPGGRAGLNRLVISKTGRTIS